MSIIQKVCANYNYFKLALFLLDDENGIQVEALEKQHHQDAENITKAIFKRWIQGSGRRPVSWNTLVIALQDAGLKELADEIEESCQ